jgi:hypothetical protein
MLTSKGQVKNEIEMRNTIMEINPPLKRSAMLRSASGRYSTALVVNKSMVTASNPTGMVVPMGLPLEKVPWNSFKQELSLNAGVKGPLITALLMREGDPVCCSYLRIAELVNRDIIQGIGALGNEPVSAAAAAEAVNRRSNGVSVVSPRTSGFRMIRLEVSDDSNK